MIVLRCSHPGKGNFGAPVIIDVFELNEGGHWTTVEDRSANANFRTGSPFVRNPHLSTRYLDERDEPHKHGEAGFTIAALERVVYDRIKAGIQDQRPARTIARYTCPCGIDVPADARALQIAVERLASAAVDSIELKNLPKIL